MSTWERLPMPPLAEDLRDIDFRRYIKGPCRVLIGHEPRPGVEGLYWHMSISCADRYPTWEEIKDARYSLLPLDRAFAQILPPVKDFVNVHPNCFHLWEIEWNNP